MIRKLALLVLVLLPTLAFGAAPVRDILLTPHGTLYTVESVDPDTIEGVDSPSTRVLQLSVRNGSEVTRHIVPATMAGAMHAQPALAYDAASDTLFIFWQKAINAMSSELLFCSFTNGSWSDATAIDRSSYNVRFGLKIASTSYVTIPTTDDDEPRRMKMLTIHAIWWEQTGYGEEARYAMLSLENGKVVSTHLRRMVDFTTGSRTEIPAEVADDFDRSIFRAPAIFARTDNGSVDVVFADWDRNRYHRVNIKPILQHGVIRVPDGVWRGEIGAPTGRIAATSGISIVEGAGDTLSMYTETAGEVRYTIHKNGTWSPVRALPLSEELTVDAAVGAIHRLTASE